MSAEANGCFEQQQLQRHDTVKFDAKCMAAEVTRDGRVSTATCTEPLLLMERRGWRLSSAKRYAWRVDC